MKNVILITDVVKELSVEKRILKNQNLWKKKVAEITFKTGDLLILGKYVPHGTAKKTKGLPRWACIVRAAYS